MLSYKFGELLSNDPISMAQAFVHAIKIGRLGYEVGMYEAA